MNYTESADFSTHAPTGQRMHDDTKPVPTVVSAEDMNMLIWSVMEVVKAGGLTGQSFDPGSSQTYQVLRNALANMQRRGYGCVAQAEGTANALTASMTPPLLGWTDGLELRIRAALANTSASPTLAVDALAAVEIVRPGGLPLEPGDVAGAGHWLTLHYDATYGKLVLLNPAKAAAGVPTGTVAAFAMTALPDGWIRANGASLSRTTYAALFGRIGTAFGAADAATFNVPDLRGVFVRGLDEGRGIDPGRGIGTYQDHQSNSLAAVDQIHQINAGGGQNVPTDGSYTGWISSGEEGVQPNQALRFRLAGVETRPRNVAFPFCIKF